MGRYDTLGAQRMDLLGYLGQKSRDSGYKNKEGTFKIKERHAPSVLLGGVYPSVKMYQILAFGDSITYGAWDSEGGWVDRLRKEMAGRFLERKGEYWLLYNLGIPGDTTRDVKERVAAEVPAHLDAGTKGVFIFALGTNDVAFETARNALRVSKDEYLANLLSILSIVQPRAERLIFLSVPPVNEPVTNAVDAGRSRTNQTIQEYNAALAEFCNANNCEFVDCYQDFLADEYLCFDGLHPNDAGHRFLVEKVKEGLQRLTFFNTQN